MELITRGNFAGFERALLKIKTESERKMCDKNYPAHTQSQSAAAQMTATLPSTEMQHRWDERWRE